jgi:excisionase family DNA binding protein
VVCVVSAIDPAIVEAVRALTGQGAPGEDGAEVRTAPHRPGRFLTVAQVAEELAVSESTVGTLIRRGRLKAVKVGGRQWRIERVKLEEFILEAYASPPENGTA